MLLSVLVAASLLAMLYPTVSDWWNSLHQSRAMASYAESEGSLDEGTCDALLAEARSYNAGLLGDAGRFSPSEEERREYEGASRHRGDQRHRHHRDREDRLLAPHLSRDRRLDAAGGCGVL